MSAISYSPIDRNALIRSDPVQLKQALHSPMSKVLLWFDGKLIIREDNTLYFQIEELQVLKNKLSEPVYLGLHQQHSYFAYQLVDWHSDCDGMELKTLRNASLTISGFHLGLLYHSQGILNWHRNHPFCARCGSETHMTYAGHGRQCSNSSCKKEHYPRIDPAVIFSVINNTGPESKILLARQPGWDAARYSVLAGFVEPGETLEDSVIREAYEETGLRVNSICYVDSQPWPFPGQIMLGFSCETTQTEIKLLDHELETADWFSASDLETKILSGELKMPFQVSLSWYLINDWFSRQTGYSISRE